MHVTRWAAVMMALCLPMLPACKRSSPSATKISPPPYKPPGPLVVPDGHFVTTSVTLQHFGGSSRTELTTLVQRDPATKEYRVTWSVDYQEGSGPVVSDGAELKLEDRDAKWFGYVEGPGRVWWFNGSKVLYLAEMKGRTMILWPSLDDEGKLRPVVPLPPREVILRLPEEMKKKFPLVPEAQEKRPPSI